MDEARRLPPDVRRDLLRYLSGTSEERARTIGEISEKTPALASLLMDLEADDDLRAMFEIALLHAEP